MAGIKRKSGRYPWEEVYMTKEEREEFTETLKQKGFSDEDIENINGRRDTIKTYEELYNEFNDGLLEHIRTKYSSLDFKERDLNELTWLLDVREVLQDCVKSKLNRDPMLGEVDDDIEDWLVFSISKTIEAVEGTENEIPFIKDFIKKLGSLIVWK